jgi:hypothetical protein
MSFGERFLALPDLFPARRSGEPWGEEDLAVDLPGGPYRLEGMTRAQATVVEERFGPLAGPPSAAPAARARGAEGVSLRVFRASAQDFLEIETAGWEYTFDTEHAPGGMRLAGLDVMARVDHGPSPGAALWTHLTGEPGFLQAIENVLRLFLAYRVFDQGGLVLHSSAAIAEDKAFLFVGRSGAGKSTAARLSLEAGYGVLSDDLNAIEHRAGAFTLRALPFTGDLAPSATRPGSFAIERLCRLEHSPSHQTTPLSRAERVALLVACAPFLNADPERSAALLERAAALAEALPACTLRFRPDAGFWGVLVESSAERG